MKKYMFLCAGMCMVLAMASCGTTKESAYRKAYEKAQAKEQDQASNDNDSDVPVVTPLVEKPATDTRVTDVDNATVRQENVSLINGNGLKTFSVVVGSFGVKANAEGLQERLKSAGYDAQIVLNTANNMYRVVAATFDNKADAVNSRNQFRSTYSDAWLLYNRQ